MANPAAANGNTAATLVLQALQAEVAALRQSLALMLETQATHTEMLRQLLQAAALSEQESPLSEAMAQVAATLSHYAEGLGAIRTVLQRLPEDVGDAVGKAVRESLSRG